MKHVPKCCCCQWVSWCYQCSVKLSAFISIQYIIDPKEKCQIWQIFSWFWSRVYYGNCFIVQPDPTFILCLCLERNNCSPSDRIKQLVLCTNFIYSPNQIISIYISQSCNLSTEAKNLWQTMRESTSHSPVFMRKASESDRGELLPSCTWSSHSFSVYFMLMATSLASQGNVCLQQSNQYSGKVICFLQTPT